MNTDSRSDSSIEAKLKVSAELARRRLAMAASFLIGRTRTIIRSLYRVISPRKDWIRYVNSERSSIFIRMHRMG